MRTKWAKQLLNKYVSPPPRKKKKSFNLKNPSACKDKDSELGLFLGVCVRFLFCSRSERWGCWIWDREHHWHLFLLLPPLGGADRQQRVWLCPPRGPRGDGGTAGHEAPAGPGSPLAGHRRGRSKLRIFLLPVGDPWTRWELQSPHAGWWAGPLPMIALKLPVWRDYK